MLRFSPANAKIVALLKVPELAKFLTDKRKVYSLDLLSGWSCPCAKDCLSKVKIVDDKRKIFDGPDTQFRCFSASQEALFPAVYAMRTENYKVLKSCKTVMGMVDVIESAMPKNTGIVRIHVAGDFFSQNYFDAWAMVAERNPSILFYAYTKSLPFWLKRREGLRKVSNFVLTASYGGRHDHLIGKHRLRFARVVLAEKAAKRLPIDHDDSHAAMPSTRRKSFALLIHGTQPKGSDAGKAVKALKGVGSYRKGGK